MAEREQNLDIGSPRKSEETASLSLVSVTAPGKGGDLLDVEQPGVGSWIKSNIVNPAANTLLIDTHNAISSSLNDLSKGVGASPLLDDWQKYSVPAAKMFSPEWFAQNISGGLAMTVPYGLAALSTRGALVGVGSRVGLEGAAADLLKSRSTSLILGATIYDGMKKPMDGETRYGNALGAAAGFATFESGNFLGRGQAGFNLVLARGFTGALGAVNQLSVSHLVSQHELPTGEQLINAAASGAVLNNALPKVTEKLSDMLDSAKLSAGKGVLADDYMDRLARKSGSDVRSNSPTLSETLAELPWLKVKEGTTDQAIHSKNLVEITPGPDLMAKIGHEASHLIKDPVIESRFARAADLLKQGKVEAARELYMNAREASENLGVRKENEIRQELNLSPALEPAGSILNLPDWQASNGQTYRSIWNQEFDRFVQSGGQFRPEIDFRPRAESSSPQTWQSIANGFESLPKDAKLSAAANLKNAPDNLARRVFTSLLKDADLELRVAAIKNIGQLSPSSRSKAWHEAFASSEASTKTAALSAISELPASERLAAWNFALKQISTIRPSDSLTEKTRAQHIVDAIEQLPTRDRMDAWRSAMTNFEVSLSARNALKVLPEAQRTEAWREMLNRDLSRTDSLAKQIEKLPANDRAAALRDVLSKDEQISPEHISVAIRSIPSEGLLSAENSILKVADAAQRNELLKMLPIHNLADLPLAERATQLMELINKANETAGTVSALRHWWQHLLPEPAVADSTSPVRAQPVKDYLAANMQAELLAKIVIPDNAELAANAARHAPESLRVAARSSDGTPNEYLNQVLNLHIAGKSPSNLIASLNESAARDSLAVPELAPAIQVVGQLLRSAPAEQKAAAYAGLAKTIISDSSAKSAKDIAANLAAAARVEADGFADKFFKPVQDFVLDKTIDPYKRLEVASEIARLSREGKLEGLDIKYPSMRSAERIILSSEQQSQLRAKFEKSFSEPKSIDALLYNNDARSLLRLLGVEDAQVLRSLSRMKTALDAVKSNSRFAELAPSDQTNLLLATAIETASGAKASAAKGWESASRAYAFLDSLGYAPEKVQRVATLLSRRAELSPETANLARIGRDPNYQKDLASFFRQQDALKQVSILNESLLNPSSANRPKELESIARIESQIQSARQGLDNAFLPLLSSEIPNRFGVFYMQGDWRAFGHTSPFIESTFLKQLDLMQSPNAVPALSMLGPKHLHLYNPNARIFALMTAPAENIMMAGRGSVTGVGVDWSSALAKGAEFKLQSKDLLSGINQSLREQGLPEAQDLAGLRAADNLSQLRPASADRLAADLAARQMMFDQAGPWRSFNELRAFNPTFTGMAVLRRGGNVILSGASERQAEISSLLAGKPDWLVIGGSSKASDANAVRIPADLWQKMIELRKPIMVLDP